MQIFESIQNLEKNLNIIGINQYVKYYKLTVMSLNS